MNKKVKFLLFIGLFLSFLFSIFLISNYGMNLLIHCIAVIKKIDVSEIINTSREFLWKKKILFSGFFLLGVNFILFCFLIDFKLSLNFFSVIFKKFNDLLDSLFLSNHVSKVLISRKMIARLILILILIFSISLFLLKNITKETLWYDETGQFWMAKGLNHHSKPHTPEKNLSDTLAENKAYNLDPGGYTILLHLWTKINNSPIWLRILGFSFFLLTIFTIFMTGYLLTGSFSFSCLISLLPFLYQNICEYSFEVRAYSLEYLGIGIIFLFLTLFERKKISKIFLLIFGFLISLFLFSRYTFFISISSLGCCLLVNFIHSREYTREKIISYILFFLPIGIMFIIVFFELLSHSPNISPPTYIENIMLNGKNLKHIITLFSSNFLSPAGLPIFIYLLFIFLYSLFSKKKMITAKYYFFILFSEIISIVLSFMGKMSWDINSRWSIQLQLISIFCIIFIFIELGIILKPFMKDYKNILLLFFSFFFIYLIYSGIKYNYPEKETIVYELRDFDYSSLGDNKILIPYNASTTVRYLFEYGTLKHLVHYYDNNFVIEDNYNSIVDIEKNSIKYLLIKSSETYFYKNKYSLYLGNLNPELKEDKVYELVK